MKVVLIISGNSFKSPYLSHYLEALNSLNISYDIISWNRLHVNEPGIIQFNCNASEEKGYIKRFYLYGKYLKFIKKRISEEKYEKIIVFTIALGILLYPILNTKYSKKYIFDIRDFSIMRIFMRRRFSSLIDRSFCTIISSKGYLTWLPEKKYVISHNCSSLIDYNPSIIDIDISVKRYTITTIGSIRDYNANRLLIKELGNDSRFTLKFIGSGPAENKLKRYVEINKIRNVTFYGLYNNVDQFKLIEDANFINIITKSDINSKSLITNRFYSSIIKGIPTLVNTNSYQGLIVKQYSLGCCIDLNNSISEQIFQYLSNFSVVDYNKGRKEYIKIIAQDMSTFYTKLKTFLES